MATGGGGAHLEEQLMNIDVPPLSQHAFVQLKKLIGIALDELVTRELIEAGKEELEYAVHNNIKCRDGVPACTVVVDGGWSKRSHKHSYNANSGVGVIFGAHTKKLLFIGVRNKYCSICAIAAHKQLPAPRHQCFKNWSGSSCSMESDIIVEGFSHSVQMHGLRYMWLETHLSTNLL